MREARRFHQVCWMRCDMAWNGSRWTGRSQRRRGPGFPNTAQPQPKGVTSTDGIVRPRRTPRGTEVNAPNQTNPKSEARNPKPRPSEAFETRISRISRIRSDHYRGRMEVERMTSKKRICWKPPMDTKRHESGLKEPSAWLS